MSFFLRVAILLPLLATAPALASAPTPPPEPKGATPDDARVPIGSEFNPAGVTAPLPKADDRFTNNPALNNLISPVEKTAPSLREQDEKKMEEDAKIANDPEKQQEIKEKAVEEKRKANALMNPKKFKSLMPPEAGKSKGKVPGLTPLAKGPNDTEQATEAAAEKSSSKSRFAPPSMRASKGKAAAETEAKAAPPSPKEPVSATATAAKDFQPLPPLKDPEADKPKERPSDSVYGMEKTENGMRYKRPAMPAPAGTPAATKSGKGVAPVPTGTPAAATATDTATASATATAAPAPAAKSGPPAPAPKAGVTAPAPKYGMQAAPKGGVAAGKAAEVPDTEPKMEEISPDDEKIGTLFDKMN